MNRVLGIEPPRRAMVSELDERPCRAPMAALAEMARVAGKGGIIAAYVWDYAGKMELMRFFWDAAVTLDASVRPLDEGVRFPLPDGSISMTARAWAIRARVAQ